MDDNVNALLDSARRGDAGALTELLRTVRAGVLRYLVANRYSAHDAEDIAQDVCVAVLGVVPRWQETGQSAWAFVFRTTRNKMIDGHRRAARTRTESLDLDAAAAGVADHTAGPEQLAVERDGNREWEATLRRLPQTQREVLVLRAVVGLSTKETAEVLGLAAASVHVLQHRAVSRLRQLIAAEHAGTAS